MSAAGTTFILAVIQPEDSAALLTALAEAGCGATYLTARGGFLKRHAVAVLVLVSRGQVPLVINALQTTCSRRIALVTPVAEAEFGYIPEPLEVEIGGAVVFGLPVAAVNRWGPVPPRPLRPAAFADANRALAPGVIATTVSTIQEAPMLDTEPTKLVVAIVPDRVASRVVAALVERHFGATTIGSTGGFLRHGNTTILTGVPAEQAEAATRLIEETCHQARADDQQASGGIAFALPVDWRLRL